MFHGTTADKDVGSNIHFGYNFKLLFLQFNMQKVLFLISNILFPFYNHIKKKKSLQKLRCEIFIIDEKYL